MSYVCIHIYIYIYIDIHTYIHKHTNKQGVLRGLPARAGLWRLRPLLYNNLTYYMIIYNTM